MEIAESLGKKLKYYRKAMNLTQQQLAEILGMQRCAYAYYEIGKSLPKYSMLKKISQVFDISIDTLLDNNVGEDATAELENNTQYPATWFKDESFNQLTEFEQSVLLRLRLMSTAEKNGLINYMNNLKG